MTLRIKGSKREHDEIELKRYDDCVIVMINDDTVCCFDDDGSFHFAGRRVANHYHSRWDE